MSKAEHRAEVLRKLQAWHVIHTRMESQIETFREVAGRGESPLVDAMWSMWDAYTHTLSGLIGDNTAWLPWYAADCEMGRKPKEVTSLGGRKRTIGTLKQLAALICEEAQ